MAVIGATGSGKSTLIADLALGVLDAEAGATVIDPHGDLATDILERVPARHAGRVHVLRLADREHPRGFNFLERATPDQGQLVSSEFVQLIHDLWPEFTGPKMQHYLRHALLTLLSDPAPQTILELIRVLTDDAFRERYRAARFRGTGMARVGPALCHFVAIALASPIDRVRSVRPVRPPA
jgi:DNA helicase HerA-like ATPase